MTSPFKDFFKNKRIFITGHTGFKGSWLSLWLTEMGACVTGYSKDIPVGEGFLKSRALFNSLGLENRLNHITGDVRDYEKLQKSLIKADPHIIFHLAAQALVRQSYKDPVETFSTNLMGTVNIMQALNILNKTIPASRAFVNVTTDKCYENREWCWPYRETDTLGGFDPYSSSKACSEIASASMARSFFGHDNAGPENGFSKVSCSKKSLVNIASARAGNVIGGGDQARDRIVPDCIRALSRDCPVLLRSPGSVRPWQHVLEPLYGYLLLGLRLYSPGGFRYRGAWNFGPDPEDELTVEDLVKKIIQTWGKGEYTLSDSPKKLNQSNPEPHEAGRLKLDISKAKNFLKWQPLMKASQAIAMTVSWYRNFYSESGVSMADFTAAQISEFSLLMREHNDI
jgi:CDP-glucose 4,6-dehydratase